MNKLQKENMETHLMNISYLKENKNPSKKQLKKMYEYLDYCYLCGKPIRLMDSFNHGFEGNYHKFGCSLILIWLGRIYTPLSMIFRLIFSLIVLPFYFIYWLYSIWGEK